MTTLQELAGDVIAYGAYASALQSISHFTFAVNPVLPTSWPELVMRYAAGSSVVFGLVGLYTYRHQDATAADALAVHAAILAGSGIAVAILHRSEERRRLAAAEALERQYKEEDAGHVASPPAGTIISLPQSRRVGR